MDGKDFEKICQERMDKEHEDGKLHASRYGVMVNHINGPTGQRELVALQSLPDFEGVIPPFGRQFIFDCKVCSQASFDLSKYVDGPGENRSRVRQLKHMERRARMGVTCFFLIHFPVRELKTKTDPEMTVAFPVKDNEFWERVHAKETTSITRADCMQFGVLVEWNCGERERKERPDVLAAIRKLGGYSDGKEEI